MACMLSTWKGTASMVDGMTIIVFVSGPELPRQPEPPRLTREMVTEYIFRKMPEIDVPEPLEVEPTNHLPRAPKVIPLPWQMHGQHRAIRHLQAPNCKGGLR